MHDVGQRSEAVLALRGEVLGPSRQCHVGRSCHTTSPTSSKMKAVFLGAILAAPAVAGRKLLDMTPGQAQNLKNLQQQAAVAQGQQQQAALQLAAAQSQVAQASEQLANQENQLADVNAAQQSNVAELSVLLPPQGAPGPAPQSAAGAYLTHVPRGGAGARGKRTAWEGRLEFGLP